MIKRSYFMSVKKPHNDGKGSYTLNHFRCEWVSLFPKPDDVFEFMVKHAEERMSDTPGESLAIVAFNRV